MMPRVIFVDRERLEVGLDDVRRSPRDRGAVALLVRRPGLARRELLEEATLDLTTGLVGDTWLERGSRRTVDGSADPAAQITVMNIRAAALVAGHDEQRIPLAGDQVYVDLDLSVDNLPPGSLLSVGDAVLEVSGKPHTGCQKFIDRFGEDAMRFVSSPEGRRLRLRGMNTRIVVPGTVRVGDTVAVSQVSSGSAAAPDAAAAPSAGSA